MARKWRELAPFYFRATTTRHFFTFAPPRTAPPLLVRASGAVALKVAQVPSTVRHKIFASPPYFSKLAHLAT